MAITNYYTDPFRLGNASFEFENQEALNTNGVSVADTREAINIVETNVFSNILDFLCPFINLNLFGLRNYPSTLSSCIHDLLRQIPIYFVNHGLCGQMTIDGHEIPSDMQLSYTLTWEDLRNIAEWREWPIREENESKYIQLREVLALYEKDPSSARHHYVGRYPIDDYTEISQKRRIYLWVDHINDYAVANGCSYKSILIFTLYHELGHLIIDSMYERMRLNPPPMLLRPHSFDRDQIASIYNVIRDIKEESLAEGMALYILNNSAGIDIFDTTTIYSLVSQKTVSYALGLSYADKRQLESAVPTWILAKQCRYVGIRDYWDWLATIANGPTIPWSQLLPYEYELYRRSLS